jgi:hypothetical protein
LAFLAIAFLITQTTDAAELTVYGKGGVSAGNSGGGTTIKICPEPSSAKCASLTIDLNEIKINGVDGSVILISKDDISVLIMPNTNSDTHYVQGDSIEIKLIE